ncbi:unnamed protein product [Blepharisma stoltei]|uniref:CCT domain-containing protein n=1 Tax=Blepharisma stoltei TaxID=1481888 RepID=A0AAU9KG97_9CILI|nr:unnamed protein product [Blepharisma stoltei]
MVECIDEYLGSEYTCQFDFMLDSMQAELMHPNERKLSFVDLLSHSYAHHVDIMPSIESMPEHFDESTLTQSFTQDDCDVKLNPLIYEVYETQIQKQKKKKPVASKDTIVVIHKPVELTPDHIIGTITLEERRKKIKKYLEKRQRRTWNKKISYDCRKRVADGRLRIKGRFVTKEQAIAILGIDHPAVQNLLAMERESQNN